MRTVFSCCIKQTGSASHALFRSRRAFNSVYQIKRQFNTKGKADSWTGSYLRNSLLITIAAGSGVIGGSIILLADVGQDPPAKDNDDKNTTSKRKKKKKVLVLGTGWAGVSFLKCLDTSQYDVEVISPSNFFVFTPLLPSVTSGTVEARSIIESVRKITLRKNIKFYQANCTRIDPVNRKVICKPVSQTTVYGNADFEVTYDYLIIAVGAQVNTFNTPGVDQYCHFLKDIEDAKRIRKSIVDVFEVASLPTTSVAEKRQLLHFVTVGGGPTGVEFAAELHDLLHDDLYNTYPDLKDYVKIVVIQSADHILNMFDERISKFAEEKFKRDGIEVKTGCKVLEVKEKSVLMEERNKQKVDVPYGMVVWSTGIGTRPLIADFMKQIGQNNRRVLSIDEWLRVKGCENTYALGDCATIEQRKLLEDVAYIFKMADKDSSGTLTAEEFKDAIETIRGRYPQIDLYLKHKGMKDAIRIFEDSLKEGKENASVLDIEEFKKALSKVDAQMKTLPATAQVAAQQGEYLAKCFNTRVETDAHPEGPVRVRGEGRHHFRPFIYKHLGQFAPLGSEQTAAQLPGDWISIGRSTQWLWYSVYASKQVSWRTRASVVCDWVKRSMFGRDTSRT